MGQRDVLHFHHFLLLFSTRPLSFFSVRLLETLLGAGGQAMAYSSVFLSFSFGWFKNYRRSSLMCWIFLFIVFSLSLFSTHHRKCKNVPDWHHFFYIIHACFVFVSACTSKVFLCLYMPLLLVQHATDTERRGITSPFVNRLSGCIGDLQQQSFSPKACKSQSCFLSLYLCTHHYSSNKTICVPLLRGSMGL